MKALTLTQPYASLIALGQKKIETRSWRTSFRGPLAIHAADGLGPVGGRRGLVRLLCGSHFQDVLGPIYGRGVMNIDAMPRGAIVAVCNLIDCQPTDDPTARYGWIYIRKDNTSIDFPLTDQERAFGDYSPGRYAWLLADVRMLPEPIPARGQLGLWEWDGEL